MKDGNNTNLNLKDLEKQECFIFKESELSLKPKEYITNKK